MKEITLDIPLAEVGSTLFREKSKRGEVVDYLRPLRMDAGNLTSIVRFRFASGLGNPKSLLGLDGVSHVEVISEEAGTYVCLMTTRPSGKLADLLKGFGKTFFMKETPSLREGLFSVTLVGTEKALREFSGRLNRYGVSFRVRRVRGVDAATPDLLAVLTSKQREVLSLAHEFGYFRRPKGMSSEELARLLGIDKSTFLEHLRKAERRLLDSLLGERTDAARSVGRPSD